MVEFAPSILAADFLRLGEQIKEAAAAGADRFHIEAGLQNLMQVILRR